MQKNCLDLLEGIFAFSLPICLWICANDEAPLFLRLWEMQWRIICQGISGGALYFRPQVRIATCSQNMAVAVGIIMASKEAVFDFSNAGDRLLAIKLHARKEDIRLNLNGCAGDLSSRTQQKAF